ncbi:MAG: AI-2E family transporter, partial [Planctomycetota bacterium]
ALLYLGVQLLESYIILPLVQRRAVELPPALVILAIVLLGSWAGVLGALVATPLLATVIVLVKMLYVEDHLGDHTAAVIGDGD